MNGGHLRCSDEDREHVAEALRTAAGEGRLTLSSLEIRLEATYNARTYADLAPLTSDLPKVHTHDVRFVPVEGRVHDARHSDRMPEIGSPRDRVSASRIAGVRIVSVNIGKPRPNEWKDGAAFTGIDKHPVDGSIEVRAASPKPSGQVGLAGDRVGDVRNHGGTNQALYAYAREDYDHFETLLGRDLRSGMFGDNLTVEGYDLRQARSGERWQGPDGLVLEVTNPRVPCGTFRGWMDEKGWLKTFTKEARSGAYLKVVAPGAVAKGTELEVVYRPDNDLTITNLFRAGMGDRDLAMRFLDSGALNDEMIGYLRALYKLD